MKMQFKDIPIGAKFFDHAINDTMVKVGDDAAERANSSNHVEYFYGQSENFVVSAFPAGDIDIEQAVNLLVETCHHASLTAGWWHDKDGNHLNQNPLSFSNKIALAHSELSEALEGDRKGLMDDKLPHRPMREVELADAIIRIFDLAGAYGMDLGGAVEEKMAFNKVRPDHQKENREKEGGKSY